MRLIDADKVKQVIKDYWKAQVNKALTLTDVNEANKRINSYLEHNHELLKLIDELPSAEPYTTTHDSIPAKTGKNDGDGTSGDCISRTQAIDEIHEDAEWLASQGSDWQVERTERDKSILMSLPSVQPERKIGKWIDGVLPNNNGGLPVQICDQCNTFFPLAYTGGGHHFCPNCGADMRGEQE